MRKVVQLLESWNHFSEGLCIYKKTNYGKYFKHKNYFSEALYIFKKARLLQEGMKITPEKGSAFKNTQWRNLEAFDTFIDAVFGQFLYCLSMVLGRFWQAFDLFLVFLCGFMDLNWTLANRLSSYYYIGYI